ncbi:unnamed protein product [Calypogeia fissa]
MKGREVVALALVLVLLGSGGHFRHVECQKVGPAPLTPQATAALTPTFYATSCPNVNQIVRDSIGASMNSSQIVGPSVLRLFAHDCFVGGCDGSILLQDTSPTSQVERDASDNLSLQQLSFDAITSAKAAVEAQCPGVVSCADILVLASEDVVSMMGGPSWTVLLGRRDGLNSSEASVAGHLPGADMNVSQMMDIFTSIGLSAQDLVTLSGAHTVGFAHCKEFANRLYNFNNVTNVNATDPSLSASYLPTLQALCPRGNYSNTTVQALDPITAGVFDSNYYQQLQIGRGLLFSDQVLYVDNVTSNLVTTYANNQVQFFADFVTSMIAMSQVGVLTGAQGEVRLNCSMMNGANSVVPGNATSVPPPVPAPVPPANSTSNSTKPPVPPVIIPTPPVVIPSPPPPVVIPSPLPPVVIPSPPPPVVIPSPPPPVVIPSPPPPVVIPSPPPPVVIPSPPPPVVIPSPPPPVVIPSPPPPVVIPSPPPPVVIPSPPPPVVIPSPTPPVVLPSPPPPVVIPSPPPPVVVASPPPPVARATPTLRPVTASPPPPVRVPGGRIRS